MKKTLLSICILLFAAITLYAQKFELGLNAGVQHNGHLRNLPTHGPVMLEPQMSITPALSLKGIYNHKNWQLGLSIDYRKLNFAHTTLPQDGDFMTCILPPTTTGSITYMPVSALVNRKFSLKKLDLYGGASVGYAPIWASEGKYGDMPQKFSFANKGGLCCGIQCGGNYRVNNRIAINAEVGANYIHFKQDKFDPSYTFSIPATLGFRYRLKPDTNKLRTN